VTLDGTSEGTMARIAGRNMENATRGGLKETAHIRYGTLIAFTKETMVLGCAVY
jgi:hypothetical protein